MAEKHGQMRFRQQMHLFGLDVFRYEFGHRADMKLIGNDFDRHHQQPIGVLFPQATVQLRAIVERFVENLGSALKILLGQAHILGRINGGQKLFDEIIPAVLDRCTPLGGAGVFCRKISGLSV